ncbi:RNase H domain-containing protein [Trichonephila clavipes]|nr:RNase H domain-containing protein [Trichonephila clavipes]
MATVIADGIPNGQGAPLKEQNLSSLKQQMTLQYLHHAKFFVIHRTEGDTFSSVSPFLIQKGLSATVGSVKAVSKVRSGDLLVEVSTTKQAEQLLALQMLANIPITVLPHANLNSSRGVISESDLYNVPEQEILEGLQDQKVCAVRRITIRRDGQVVNTKHLILTFACPDLPQFITAGYLRCSVRPYIPNPLRCFQCQRFGHSKPTCRGKPTCARCGEVGHDSGECNGEEKYVNCKGDHPSYSRSCNTWKFEKEITTVKIKNRLTYPEARLAVTNRTPIQGLSYAAVAKKVTTSSGTQTSPVTIIDNSKDKIPEQPSQKHSPRKDNKKVIVKPKTTLKKKPGKNVSLKIARETDSLYESTPISKRSRRRKTSQTSDAMDTDVNPSDTDYVIGQASEEDESLLEANFKQATSHIDDVKAIIHKYRPVCVALQETFLKSCHTAKIRRYGCVRKDTDGSSVSGGVCIFTSLDIPSSALSLHTSLQAVAVRNHSTSLFTVCCLYLPPNAVIRQQDLNDLVDQLPAPFVILGDFNGHSMDRMKLHISELDLPNVSIQQRNLFLFQPWNTPRFLYVNPFATYSKSTVAPVVFQRVFAYHRSQYSRYSAIYTDGSKRADYVGCGVVIEDIMHGYRLDTSCSIFTAEAVAIYRALQLIDSTMPRKYCIYADSMSVLEALANYHDRCDPVVCTILDITSRLYSKGFDIVFCWLPSHVGIIGNEQADNAAKSATTHLPLAVPLSDMKRVIMHHIFNIWQESWSQQLDNKLHSVKPVIGAWPVMPMRRTDVKLTRLRIGHTRFTHRHLLFGERAPECPSCNVSYTVHHILVDCPIFNHYRMTFFHKSVLTLSDLVGESPHQNVFAFIKKIGFLYFI